MCKHGAKCVVDVALGFKSIILTLIIIIIIVITCCLGVGRDGVRVEFEHQL